MIITIDGPSGTGKTSVARRVAECLDFPYFDTGAMYRCLAWFALHQNVDIFNASDVERLLPQFHFRIIGIGKEKRYFVGDVDVSMDIRTQPITRAVSAIAAIPSVRAKLTQIQREFAEKGDAVFEGRDLGTVVFPHAEIKIFLTARAEIRAQRRLDEMRAKNPSDVKGMDLDLMANELKRRDLLDSTRTIAPLKCPEDAYVIDTSDLTLDEVVAKVLEYKMEKMEA